jgi:hypothetical protein
VRFIIAEQFKFKIDGNQEITQGRPSEQAGSFA